MTEHEQECHDVPQCCRELTTLLRVAEALPTTPAWRERIRDIVGEPLRQLAHEARVTADCSNGPDPEECLPLVLALYRSMCAMVREIDEALAACGPMRAGLMVLSSPPPVAAVNAVLTPSK